uniref:SKI-interacting protein SKIP SNW domain-containing protein n=2 Tax=Panagrolaimus sp. ES5 TaxID=591445 RepID=A0AC34FPY1_9BILA
MIDDEDPELQKPDEDAIRETTEETKAALEKIVSSKIASALPVQHAKKVGESQFIRYTPSTQAAGRPAQQRIIRVVEEQVDPMEPPKFKINQKIPRPPPSPPAPVLHSPPRRVSAQEQSDWKIPPCISNWKNPKGYTVALDKRLAADGRGLQQTHINENFAKFAEALNLAERSAPLDKRLAADGRGLQQTHINENFAKFAEALNLAERSARDAVEARNQVKKSIALKNKSAQEQKMREMALQAKQERAKNKSSTKEEIDEDAREREAIRRDQLDNIRRERNIARSRPDKLEKLRHDKDRDVSEKIALGLPDSHKLEKLRHDKDRDVSEKIALGLPDSRARNGETLFDARLFDQSKGLDSGGIDDETYSAYDKPWRPETNIQRIYRPTKNNESSMAEDMDRIITTNRFVPEKGFAGAGEQSGARSGPVQFEKQQPNEDLFGLDDLIGDSSSRKRSGRDDDYSNKRSRH